MSVFVPPVPPVTPDESTIVEENDQIQVVSGPVIVAPGTGNSVELVPVGETGVASGTQQADILVTNVEDSGVTPAPISIGVALDSEGNTLDSSGSSFQIADNYQGSVTVNLADAITDGASVDLSVASIGEGVPGDSGTIADNAPADSEPFAYYVNTGSADDEVEGSDAADFVRLGVGDDTFKLGAGNDVLRTGPGNDFGSLGEGDDTLYLTIDQLQGDFTKTISDFDELGDDQILIDVADDIADNIDISGLGTNEITITLSGDPSGTTTIVSNGETIDDDDVTFV